MSTIDFTHSVSDFAGDWNLGGDLDGAEGALGVVRGYLEEKWDEDLRDLNGPAILAEAILLAYRLNSKNVPNCCTRVYKQNVSSQANGSRIIFSTSTKLASGQSNLYLNGLRWTRGFVVLSESTFKLEPYGTGTAAYADDTIEIDGVVVISPDDGALWFDEDTNSGHLVTIGL